METVIFTNIIAPNSYGVKIQIWLDSPCDNFLSYGSLDYFYKKCQISTICNEGYIYIFSEKSKASRIFNSLYRHFFLNTNSFWKKSFSIHFSAIHEYAIFICGLKFRPKLTLEILFCNREVIFYIWQQQNYFLR